MPPAVGLVLAYLLGSIPSAYIAGKHVRGIDLRRHGSGNLGATNVYRTLGAKVAVVVLLADTAKGALPVLLLPMVTVTQAPMQWAVAYGIAAIAGHVRPIFLMGRGGGKGVATAGGVFLALAPMAMGISFAIWLLVLLTTGFVSLASLASAATIPIVLAITHGPTSPLFIVGCLIALFVFWTHRANIGRLRRGEEQRFGKKRGIATSEAQPAIREGAVAGEREDRA